MNSPITIAIEYFSAPKDLAVSHQFVKEIGEDKKYLQRI